jgi:hypothetical protein
MGNIVCAICKKKIPQKDIDKWCYHTSFPGPVCRSHHGVKEEYNNLCKNEQCVLAIWDSDWAAMCCLHCGKKVKYAGDELCEACQMAEVIS